MNRTMRWPHAGISTLLVLCLSSEASAQPYRDGLPVASTELNRSLLRFIEERDFIKITLSIPTLKPLLDVFKTKYGRDLETELQISVTQQDYPGGLLLVHRLIYYDMLDLLTVGLTGMEGPAAGSKSASKFKSAFLDYQLLSPFVNEKNFKSDQKIRNLFRNVILAVDASSPYRGDEAGASELHKVRTGVNQIDAEILSVFPNLK